MIQISVCKVGLLLADCKIESHTNANEKRMGEYVLPKHIKSVKQLPYTQNNKYDFRTLEKLGNDYVAEHNA